MGCSVIAIEVLKLVTTTEKSIFEVYQCEICFKLCLIAEEGGQMERNQMVKM